MFGANAGLGFQISRALSQRGFRVILACRNPEKAETAIASLQSE
ncbi:SDR family NAD(P)-dependent oxidoreductase, partial [Zhongshania sp.]